MPPSTTRHTQTKLRTLRISQPNPTKRHRINIGIRDGIRLLDLTPVR